MNQILVDSSFLTAIYHSGDKYHQRARSFGKNKARFLLIPDVVLPECAFLLRRVGGIPAVSLFIKGLVALEPAFEPITLIDLRRADEIMMAYPAARLDLVDCCIVALAERLNITQVCTFDRRDFNIIRPNHCDHLDLLPQ